MRALVLTAKALRTRQRPLDIIGRALLESFLVHYRNIACFLDKDLPRRPQRSIRALEHAPHWKPKHRTVVGQDVRRINQLLQHLSAGRLDDAKDWDIQGMAKRMRTLFVDFAASAQVDYGDIPRLQPSSPGELMGSVRTTTETKHESSASTD